MLALLSAVASLGSGIIGAVGRSRAAAANRRFANQMADDVLARGEREAELTEMRVNQTLGSRRVALAAQGIDVSQDTSATILDQTAFYGRQDIDQIRMNAAREAWGIRTQARLNARAETNAAWAQGVGAVGQFATSDAGRTLLTRPVDAWQSFMSRRRLLPAFADPAWS